ncbi:MAG: relaxase [Pseudomonadota bacterium]
MILVGNSRGGARNLADHLMKKENDHVTVHELRGFASDNLHGCLNEAYAVSRGTKCKQFLYSLSLNPPPQEQVSTPDFESAIDRAEERLGLSGQPRAIVFHEKDGRRHAHAVWSRIDTDTMTAKQMSYDRMKMQEVSRELYREHGWRMPEGLADRTKSDPRNYTLADWQQAKRHERDPQQVIDAISDSWSISDSRTAFDHALKERGLYLARGDKRPFVAVDTDGEIHSITRKAGIKRKEAEQRLGDPQDLQSVEQAKDQMAQDMSQMLGRLYNEQADQTRLSKERYEKAKAAEIERQRRERAVFDQRQQERQLREQAERQERFRRGLLGLWDRLSGKHKQLTEQNRIETEAARKRDQGERDRLIEQQLEQRRAIQQQAQSRQQEIGQQTEELQTDRERFIAMRRQQSIQKQQMIRNFNLER